MPSAAPISDTEDPRPTHEPTNLDRDDQSEPTADPTDHAPRAVGGLGGGAALAPPNQNDHEPTNLDRDDQSEPTADPTDHAPRAVGGLGGGAALAPPQLKWTS